ncbi:PREDICTED: GDSL esterase/lipase 7 [Theobroma cacao]|uniref:GDSL esterase/lipase 7 n=1 Tax=Theobroma cacao TaxID=3641 RepID=A0AB32W730_THECC|nr:PREDICTED: GDSL esterase/lipase 7 [Theobroma cacao]
MAKLGCPISVCVFVFFHLLQLFSYGVGDVLEVPTFNINQQSLLQYLYLGDIKIDLPALYVFGDSYVDNGNNNFLPHSAVANYLPFGIDFDGKPTGRATNGRTVVDFVATLAGFQYPPPILSMSEADRKTTRTGLNYASGSSEILSENGRFLKMNVLNFFQQVDLFENATLKDLKSSFSSKESFTKYLSKSVFFIHIASNDLGLTYETATPKYSPDKYAELLVEELSKQLQRLYKLGARKFLVNNVSPLGCQPFNINAKNHTTSCVEEVNERISIYNKLLSNSLTKLQSTLSGSKFIVGDLYKIFQDVYASPASYGFKDVNTSCCFDSNGTRIQACAPNAAPCEDRQGRVFFDPFHPSESMHFLWARRLLKDSSVCSPINLIQLMQA